MLLSGKVVIVTGAVHGIGRGIAEAVAAAGAKVMLADIDEASGREAIEAFQTKGWEAGLFVGDLTKEANCQRLIESTVEKWGRLDGLVNNVGWYPRANLEDTTEELWDQVMSANLKPTVFCCKHAIPVMLSQECGAIINLSSGNAYGGSSDLLAYSTSKGALNTLTRNLAGRFGRKKIRINLLNPGWVLTEKEIQVQAEKGNDLNWLNEIILKRPLGKFQEAKDSGPAAIYLLSDDASSISGQTINLDGI